MKSIPWWTLVPDAKHEFVTAGFGEWKKADYATAARGEDGSCGVVYLPSKRAITINRGVLNPKSKAFWFDPTSAALKVADGRPLGGGQEEFTPPEQNAAKEEDWVLCFK